MMALLFTNLESGSSINHLSTLKTSMTLNFPLIVLRKRDGGLVVIRKKQVKVVRSLGAVKFGD